ncbi:hypothetical protein Pcinc_013784 [Petrolisthes cinctipes]|uniref:Uncharacterized protein n=1 Tax=Petrolisthes cinctipes TaxID=88211 RepID=A0AAE1FW94_PETCI|nr:hypothetical protein Pcinc_013784 [Petrolisthes cinctipes]
MLPTPLSHANPHPHSPHTLSTFDPQSLQVCTGPAFDSPRPNLRRPSPPKLPMPYRLAPRPSIPPYVLLSPLTNQTAPALLSPRPAPPHLASAPRQGYFWAWPGAVLARLHMG